MTTAIQMITRSMRLVGAIGKGEAPDDDEAADGLTSLNSMLPSWSIERLYAYYVVEESFPLTSATSYTMGPGGDFDTVRPTRIEDANFIRYGSGSSAYDLHLQLLNFEAYASIIAKGITSNVGQYMYVDMQNPLAVIKFVPIPTGSGGVLHIFSWKQLQTFSTLTDVLALPPGYERAIVFSLAEEIAGEYGLPVPPQVSAIALKSRANLKRINAPSPVMRSEAGMMTRRWGSDSIYWGT